MTIEANGKKSFQWVSLIQFIISILGVLINLAGAVILFVVGIIMKFSSPLGESALQFFNYGWGTLAIAFLLVPSALLSLTRFSGWKIKIPSLKNSILLSSIALLAVPILIGIGGWISKQPAVSWLLLPPMQVAIILIPLWWLIEIGRRKIQSVQPQEGWGVLGFGLLIMPVITLTIEIILFIIVLVGLVIWLANFPGLGELLNRLVTRLSMSQADPETLLRIFRPFVTDQPWVYVTVGVLLGGFIPLLEEILKPLAVWGFSFKKPSLGTGLVMGMICGAAFAFWESSSNLAAVATDGWVTMVTGRLGTGLLHTINSGLVGFGLAAAWTKRKYLWMVGTLLLAFIQHAAWNVLVLVDASAEMTGFSSGLLTEKIVLFPSGIVIILLLLLAFMLCSLFLVNLFIQREEKLELAKSTESDKMMSLDMPNGIH